MTAFSVAGFRRARERGFPAVGIRGRANERDRARLFEVGVVLAVSSFGRKVTGSACAATASSCMNDSEAKLTCGPFRSRALQPVSN